MDDFNTRLYEAGIDAGDIDYNRAGFQRVRTADKPSKRNGAVLVLSPRPLRVWFQNHATGVTGVATEGGPRFISRADWDRVQAARAAEQWQRDKGQRDAAARAESGWEAADAADAAHPYLVAKRVQPNGLRQSEDGYLLVPMRCAGLVWNIQTIAPDGTKLFMAGARKSGCWFSMGPKPTTTVLLAEGFATGASLYEALGLPVAVCFDCGNLLRVGQILRERYPRAELIYAADNDIGTENNPGVTAATKAARETRGFVVFPQFGLADAGRSDWNDFAVAYGPEALHACFTETLHHVG